jgi:uncharacterized protein (TIGR01777 family)
MMDRHILLTGATGMLGKDLISTLLSCGDHVSILSRKPQQINGVNVFLWDIKKQTIDHTCIAGIDTIIHLAGESISTKRWTAQRKKDIIDSRVESIKLLYKTLSNSANDVKNFVSASAVGVYGDRGDELLTEDSAPGNDFLSECCIQWEAAADAIKDLGLRVVKLRTGVVLSKESGALSEMSKPVQMFAGAPLGSGKQWVPWIHHQDMTSVYMHMLDHLELEGVYNVCAPFPVTNKIMTKAIAKELHRPVWPVTVPKPVLKLILGEMSKIVLNSNRTSADKLCNSGYNFKFTHLEPALADIYN